MKTSRSVLLPVLVVVLGLVVWLGWRLASHPGAEGGPGALFTAADAEAGGAGAADLRAPTRDPAALQAPESEVAPDDATAAATDPPPEPTRTVHGRVILVDGGSLPPHLAVHASKSPPPPRLTNMRGLINDASDTASGDPLVPDSAGRNPRTVLAEATRAEVAADFSFTMPAVPASGAFVAVEDGQLYVDPPALMAAGVDTVEVQLRLGATIRGRVRNARGEPLSGADVAGGTGFDPFMVFDTAARMVALDEVKTDAEGGYTLTQVPAGLALILAAGQRGGGLQTARADVPALLPGETRVVDLQLRAASTIAGHVRTMGGEPLPRAGVLLRRTDLNLKEVTLSGRSFDDPTDNERTGEDGTFLFEGVPDGSYEVVLREDGYRQARVALSKVTAGQTLTDVDLVAEAGLPVSGIVVDPAGLPLGGVRVKGFLPPSMMDMRANLDRELRPSVNTDDQGHFELAGFDPGKVRVRAEAGGFQDGHVDVDAGETSVVLTLERTCELSGIVVSLSDGEPVTHFKVGLVPAGGLFDMADPFGMAERMEGARPGRSFHDRADGKFTLEDVRAGSYDLSVSAAGFGTVTLGDVEVGKEGRKGLIVMLPPEGSVSGLVVDGKTGRPVEGARIETVRGNMIENMVQGVLDDKPHGTTDAQGRFRLGGLAQDPVKLSVQHPEYRDLGLPEVVLAAGEQRDLGVLSLASGGAIYGRVFDGQGRGIPGVQVMVSEATGRSFKRATTDEHGAYRTGGLPAGTFNVMRMDFTMNMGGDSGPMDFLKDMVFEAVTLSADQEREVNLGAKTAGGTRLYGDVTSADGAVSGAMVTAYPDDASVSGLEFANTGKDGRYELTGLKPGSYALQVVLLESTTMAGGGPASSPVIEKLTVTGLPEQRHDVRLSGGVLNGVIESTVDGSHVPGLRVVLERTDEGLPKVGLVKATGGRVAELYSDKDGGFTFRYLPDGTFTVVAGGQNAVGMGAEGWAVTRVPDVRVSGSGPGFTLHVKVAPAGGIAGRVTDASGAALAGVSVWFLNPKGEWLSTFSEVSTENDGSYSVNSLGPGTWSVAFRDGTHALLIVPEVDVRTGKTTTLDATLQAGVALNLATGDHDPWSLQITLEGPDGPLPTELVSMDQLLGDGDGGAIAKLGVFAPGSYHLTVMAGGASLLDTTVVLAAGSEAKLVTLGS